MSPISADFEHRLRRGLKADLSQVDPAAPADGWNRVQATLRKPRMQRVAVGLAATAVLVTGVVVTPRLLSDLGGSKVTTDGGPGPSGGWADRLQCPAGQRATGDLSVDMDHVPKGTSPEEAVTYFRKTLSGPLGALTYADLAPGEQPAVFGGRSGDALKAVLRVEQLQGGEWVVAGIATCREPRREGPGSGDRGDRFPSDSCPRVDCRTHRRRCGP